MLSTAIRVDDNLDPFDGQLDPSLESSRTRRRRRPAACSHEEPALRDVTGHGHFVACHLVGPGGDAPRLVDPADMVATE